MITKSKKPTPPTPIHTNNIYIFSITYKDTIYIQESNPYTIFTFIKSLNK